jgi:hypothetical protein
MEQFLFKGFQPEPAVALKAERLFHLLLELAPEDASLSALLEWDGERHRCCLEVGHRDRPLVVEAAHRLAAIALDKAELALRRKLGPRASPKLRHPAIWRNLTDAPA